jgi:hypothetical protein
LFSSATRVRRSDPGLGELDGRFGERVGRVGGQGVSGGDDGHGSVSVLEGVNLGRQAVVCQLTTPQSCFEVEAC